MHNRVWLTEGSIPTENTLYELGALNRQPLLPASHYHGTVAGYFTIPNRPREVAAGPQKALRIRGRYSLHKQEPRKHQD